MDGDIGEPVQEPSQDDNEEAREGKALPIPDTPSRQEVLLHRLTHRPFRSWCPHCIRGKGRAAQSRKSPQKGEHGEVPKLVSDYFFVGQRRPANQVERDELEAQAEREGQTPVLVLRDTKSRAIFAHACPSKGAHDSVVNRLIGDLDTLGYKRVLVRTDCEASIIDLWSKVRERWHGEIIKMEGQLVNTTPTARPSRHARK